MIVNEIELDGCWLKNDDGGRELWKGKAQQKCGDDVICIYYWPAQNAEFPWLEGWTTKFLNRGRGQSPEHRISYWNIAYLNAGFVWPPTKPPARCAKGCSSGLCSVWQNETGSNMLCITTSMVYVMYLHTQIVPISISISNGSGLHISHQIRLHRNSFHRDQRFGIHYKSTILLQKFSVPVNSPPIGGSITY